MTPEDDETPHCALCGERIGLLTDATLMFRGQFFLNREEQYSMFIIDPDTKFVSLELENALGPGQNQQAFVLDHNDPAPLVVVHSDCLSEQVSVDDDDDDEEEDDDENYQDMLDAMERDHNPFWDKDDMLLQGRRS